MTFDQFEEFCEDLRDHIDQARGTIYFLEGYLGDRCVDEQTQCVNVLL